MTREPRVELLDGPYSPDVEEWLQRMLPMGMKPLNLFKAVANSPRLLSRFLAGSLADRGALSLREREVVILRTCAVRNCEYEWGVHVALFASKANLSQEDLMAIAHGSPTDQRWSNSDRICMEVCDTLCCTDGVDAALWARGEHALGRVALMEAVMLVGQYTMVSYLANSLGVPNESFAACFQKIGGSDSPATEDGLQ